MRKPSCWSITVTLLVALIFSAVVAPAGTPVDVDLEAGGSFAGTIENVGSEFNVRFYAVEGAAIKIKVKATSRSTLKPTIVVRNQSGAAITGTTQKISWAPFGNLLHYVTAPAGGHYIATIGSEAGNGKFTGSIAGNSMAPVVIGVLSGTVTDDDTGGLISDAAVLVDGSPFDTTDGSGDYSGELDPGDYDVTFQAAGYEDVVESITMTSANQVLDASLTPIVPATVEAGLMGDPAFGGDVTGTVSITTQPGVVVTGVEWALIFGPEGTSLAAGPNDSVVVTLGDVEDYKEHLIHVLSEPPIGEEDLPPNVPLPEGEFPGGLQDRLQVIGANPFSLEEAGLVELEVTVTTDAGVFTDHVEIHVALPWSVSTGLRNVPIGVPVLLHAESADSHVWTLADKPAGSLAELTDSDTQTPYFTPDVDGIYEFEVAAGPGIDLGIPPEVSTIEVYAGEWRGVIVGQDMEGRPISDTACTFCHNGEPILPGGDPVADTFTPWEDTGHAEIFTNLLDTSTYYGDRCFSCHMVGYDTALGADNDGVDDQDDYHAFLDEGLLGSPGDNWTTLLADFPKTARMANIQCENCHGPQDSLAHGFGGPLDEPRVSISADVCATCHGEPLRHARYQQWQLSGHANYELAVDEGDSGSCSRCHTSNGFLEWAKVLLDDDPLTDPLDDIFGCDEDTLECFGPKAGEPCDDGEGEAEDDFCIPWTLDEVHPQTCVTCHDPHNVGTSSGNNPDVNIRISDDTPPLIAGFMAEDVGRGAVCMTCHNSRRGLRNDEVWEGLTDKDRAPHGSAQTDMLMGQNAYFVNVGTPGGHAETGDTCVDCHMKATDPPDVLAYNLGGANHTFYAELTICSDCHSANLLASDVQNGVAQLLGQVEELLLDSYLTIVADQLDAGNDIDFDGDFLVENIDDLEITGFGSSRGRQAIRVSFEGVDSGVYRLTTIDIVDGNPLTEDPTLFDLAGDDTLKAGWNWGLVDNDGSVGIHNPFFASGILIAARDALIAQSPDAVPPPPAESNPWDRIDRKLDRSTERSRALQPRR